MSNWVCANQQTQNEDGNKVTWWEHTFPVRIMFIRTLRLSLDEEKWRIIVILLVVFTQNLNLTGKKKELWLQEETKLNSQSNVVIGWK